MPTQRRRESSTGFYHIVAKGINNEKIFNQPREKSYFKQIVSNHISKCKSKIYSYCFMSTHVHFMIWAELQELSILMAGILAEYAAYYNYKHHRNGHVFQNRFASECIESEAYFWNCLRYIHLNPVRANMIKSAQKYYFSSMQEYYTQNLELVDQNAMVLYNKKFRDYQDFENFHKRRHYDVFIDIKEEIKQQQLNLACQLAKEIYGKYQLSLLDQVFEEKTIRTEYIEVVQQMLQVSQRRAKELYEEVKSNVNCE